MKRIAPNVTANLFMSGYLKKKGLNDHRWHKRFVELKDKKLSFYKDETKHDVEGKVLLKGDVKVVEIEGSKFPKIKLSVNQVDFEFMTESHQIIYQWISALKNASSMNSNISMDDFLIISVIGRGFFGKVMLVQHKENHEIYAIKSIQKKMLADMRKSYTVINERNILMKINHPFIVKLCFAFQSTAKFYLGLEYAAGGEIFYHMNHRDKFEIDEIRLYAAEIALALEYLHEQGIVYRDLKPENILLDKDGHIKITDFGMSKDISQTSSTNTFCGTTDYFAPEIVLRNKYSYEVDWWALGVIMYEMIVQETPFSDETNVKIYKNILNNKQSYPPFVPKDIQDVIDILLVKDPIKRAGMSELKKSDFFKGLDWEKVYKREYIPHFQPNIQEMTIPENFDEEFTAETPIDSIVISVNEDFSGFSFINSCFNKQYT